MNRRRFRWVATYVIPLVAAILVIAKSSSGQVQEGTGKSKRSTAGLFVVNWPD